MTAIMPTPAQNHNAMPEMTATERLSSVMPSPYVFERFSPRQPDETLKAYWRRAVASVPTLDKALNTAMHEVIMSSDERLENAAALYNFLKIVKGIKSPEMRVAISMLTVDSQKRFRLLGIECSKQIMSDAPQLKNQADSLNAACFAASYLDLAYTTARKKDPDLAFCALDGAKIYVEHMQPDAPTFAASSRKIAPLFTQFCAKT